MAFNDFQKQWETKVNDACKERDEWKDQFRVELARQYFEGNQRPAHVVASEWITLNMIYSHLVAQLPALYSVDPYFYVKLKQSYNTDPMQAAKWDIKGKVRQSYLNYLKGELELKPKARLCIQDGHFAFGVMKVHYTANLKDNEQAGQPIVNEKGEELKDESGQALLQPDFIPLNGRYALTRVHPDDIIFGKGDGVLSDKWSFIGERIKIKVGDARKDKRYDQTQIKRVSDKILKDKKDKDSDIDDEIIYIYEIYDLSKNEFFAWSKDAEKPIIKPHPVPAGTEKHPYCFLRFTLRDNSPYPIPPMSQGLDPQKEYNDLRSKILTHRKRFNRKYEVNVNGLEDPDTEISKLESGDDGTVLRKMVSDQVVRPIQDAPLDQQNYQELSFLRGDMAELLGATDNARGIAKADSATEAGILDKRLEIKEGDRLSLVIDWLVEIAEKLDQLVQVHIEKEEAVKITGPEGEFWKLVTPEDYDDIDGQYAFSVNIGSTQPRLPHVERAQWIAFWSQVVIPMPAILTRPNIMKKFAEMFGIEDDAMLEEFRQLGLAMISGQLPIPGAQGSQAGIPENNPVAAAGGMAGGQLGGLVNGGGAPQ